MKILVILSFTFISFLSNGLEKKQNRTLFYDDPHVELQGRLSIKIFPGPPNYESIKAGDEAEDGYYLTLNERIDVAPDLSKPSDRKYRDDTEKNLKLIQLIVFDKKLYPVIRKFIKSKEVVKLTGVLSHSVTGHHHTSVLIEVAEISKLNSPKK